jgi:hypothetical protein
MRNTADVSGGKPIAVWLQSISDGDVVNPFVAFYDIHGRKWELAAILLFCPGHHTRLLKNRQKFILCEWTVIQFKFSILRSESLFVEVH